MFTQSFLAFHATFSFPRLCAGTLRPDGVQPFLRTEYVVQWPGGAAQSEVRPSHLLTHACTTECLTDEDSPAWVSLCLFRTRAKRLNYTFLYPAAGNQHTVDVIVAAAFQRLVIEPQGA